MFEDTNWNNKSYTLFKDYLFSLKDEKYRNFNQKIVPTVNINRMIGIRTPIIKKIAKDIIKGDYIGFLDICNNEYFEETMIEATVITMIKDEEKADKYIKQFIPKIDNWETCDLFASGLKIVNKDKEKYYNLFKNYLKTGKTYNIRICLVILLDYYIDANYIDKIFKITDSINNDDYYVNMAIAWLISICYIKFPDKTLSYLVSSKLSDFTYNKTIQKIIESRRVDNDTKKYLKTLKK